MRAKRQSRTKRLTTREGECFPKRLQFHGVDGPAHPAKNDLLPGHLVTRWRETKTVSLYECACGYTHRGDSSTPIYNHLLSEYRAGLEQTLAKAEKIAQEARTEPTVVVTVDDEKRENAEALGATEAVLSHCLEDLAVYDLSCDLRGRDMELLNRIMARRLHKLSTDMELVVVIVPVVHGREKWAEAQRVGRVGDAHDVQDLTIYQEKVPPAKDAIMADRMAAEGRSAVREMHQFRGDVWAKPSTNTGGSPGYHYFDADGVHALCGKYDAGHDGFPVNTDENAEHLHRKCRACEKKLHQLKRFGERR